MVSIAKSDIKFKYHGPIFSGEANQILSNHVKNAVEELVEMGEQHLATKYLLPRPTGVYLADSEAQPGKHSTGNFRRMLKTKTTGAKGVIYNNAKYGPWLEIGKNRRPTRFKGYHSFEQTTEYLNDEFELTMEWHIRKAVAELNSGI